MAHKAAGNEEGGQLQRRRSKDQTHGDKTKFPVRRALKSLSRLLLEGSFLLSQASFGELRRDGVLLCVLEGEPT